MAPEELERLAREAGLWRRRGIWTGEQEDFARFAALVRAQALEQAAAECVRVDASRANRGGEECEWTALYEAAAAIRALAAPQSPAADQSAP